MWIVQFVFASLCSVIFGYISITPYQLWDQRSTTLRLCFGMLSFLIGCYAVEILLRHPLRRKLLRCSAWLLPLFFTTGCDRLTERTFHFAAYNNSARRSITIVINGDEAATIGSYGEFKAKVAVRRDSYSTGPSSSEDRAEISIAVADPATHTLISEREEHCSINRDEITSITFTEEYDRNGVRNYIRCR